MSWVQVGMAKSGNFWLHTILQKIMHYGGLEEKSFIKNQPVYPVASSWKLSFEGQAAIDNLMILPGQAYYRISSIFRMPIEDLDHYVQNTSLVWLHSPVVDITGNILKKFSKIIYIVRDPRDIAVSSSRYQFTEYRKKHYPQETASPEAYLEQKSIGVSETWSRHILDYLGGFSSLGMHVVFYERLFYHFRDELQRLCEYLGVKLSDAQAEQIEKEVSFQSMTQKNATHLRKGGWGQWRETLTPSQQLRMNLVAGPLLRYMNYPLTARKEAVSRENLPSVKMPIHAPVLKSTACRLSLIRRLRALKAVARCLKP